MKHLLLIAIRVYWVVWPRHRNRTCIYRETCSHHVYRITGELGLVAGLRALRDRVRTCRPGYTISSSDTGSGIVLHDGSFLPEPLVARGVLLPIQLAITQLEERLSSEGTNG